MNGTERFPIGCRVVLARPSNPTIWPRGMTGRVVAHFGRGVRVKFDNFIQHSYNPGWFKYPEELDRAYPVVKVPPMPDAEWNERRDRVRTRYANQRISTVPGSCRLERKWQRVDRFLEQFPFRFARKGRSL